MEQSLVVLSLTAFTLALFHTAVGPDHYLPFIVLGRSEGWTLRRTLLWTFLCGVGHVLSSIVIGAIGIAVGWSVSGMEGFEGIRGELASWTLIGFGGLYMLWGLVRARSGHVHSHVHGDGSVHSHVHRHSGDDPEPFHARRPHDASHIKSHRRTLWALFLIFVLGPCEPLIPLLMVPAADHSVFGVAIVAAIFSVGTIGTMLVIATAGFLGLRLVNLGALERYVHVLSGFAILASGAAIKLLGL